MAKTIKFNLLLDDNPVRDIESLQNNFCIDNILEIYENGLLQKWLKVRGFDKHLEKVENIKKDSSIIIELIKIFDIQKDDAEIRESIYSLEFQEDRKKLLKDFDIKDNNFKSRISKYHKDYEKLIEDIVDKKEDMAFLKVASIEISDKYLKLFELDYKDSYELYKEKSPLMIYAILMNDKLSFLFMKNNIIKKDLLYFINLQKGANDTFFHKLNLPIKIQKAEEIEKVNGYYPIADKDPVFVLNVDNKVVNTLYSLGISYNFNNTLEYLNLKEVFKNIHLIYFTGATESYWKDLETTDTKVMILSIPDGTYIRNANNLKQELSAEDVNGNFLILDGLAYKSNNGYDSIVYMKV